MARTVRSVSCSWRQCMRSRRSRRRFAAPVVSRSAMGPPACVRPKRSHQTCLVVVVVVEWLHCSQRKIIVRSADLSDFFFVDFRL